MLGIGPELVDPTIDPLSSVVEQSLAHGLLPYPTVLALVQNRPARTDADNRTAQDQRRFDVNPPVNISLRVYLAAFVR